MKTNLISLVSVFTGLAGVIVAGLSLYFNYKERIKGFRESLFNRQMEIVIDLSLTITELYQTLYDLLEQISLYNFAKDKAGYHSERIQEKLKQSKICYEKFVKNYRTWLIFLPNDVNNAINDFINTYLNTQIGTFKEGLSGEYETKVNDIKLITSKYNKVLDSFREFLGIKKLSEENKKVLLSKKSFASENKG